ncbi:putative outer membrane protein [Bradyrhizobium sp. i1.4.4]
MSNRFMISVAALALVAGTGLANAQGTMNRDSGGGAGAAADATFATRRRRG